MGSKKTKERLFATPNFMRHRGTERDKRDICARVWRYKVFVIVNSNKSKNSIDLMSEMEKVLRRRFSLIDGQ